MSSSAAEMDTHWPSSPPTDLNKRGSSQAYKQQLYSQMKASGVVDVMKTQLRNHLLTKLSQGHLPLKSIKTEGRPPDLERQAVSCLLHEYLSTHELAITLSVFWPEAHMMDIPVMRPAEVLKVLGIDQSKLSALSVKAGGGKSQGQCLLLQLLNYLASFTQPGNRKVCEGTQTEESRWNQIGTRLQELDEEYLQKLRHAGSCRPSGITEERMARYQQDCDQRVRDEVERQVQRFRDVELSQMKLEEGARYRRQLERERMELDRVNMEKIRNIRQREEETMDKLRRQKREVESIAYQHRQKILQEEERIRQQQVEANKQIELDREKLRVLEEKLVVERQQVKEKEDRVAVREREALEKMRTASVVARREIEVEMSGVQSTMDAERARLEVERARVLEMRQTAAAELAAARAREDLLHTAEVARGEAEARAVAHAATEDLLRQQLKELQQELAGMRAMMAEMMAVGGAQRDMPSGSQGPLQFWKERAEKAEAGVEEITRVRDEALHRVEELSLKCEQRARDCEEVRTELQLLRQQLKDARLEFARALTVGKTKRERRRGPGPQVASQPCFKFAEAKAKREVEPLLGQDCPPCRHLPSQGSLLPGKNTFITGRMADLTREEQQLKHEEATFRQHIDAQRLSQSGDIKALMGALSGVRALRSDLVRVSDKSDGPPLIQSWSPMPGTYNTSIVSSVVPLVLQGPSPHTAHGFNLGPHNPPTPAATPCDQSFMPNITSRSGGDENHPGGCWSGLHATPNMGHADMLQPPLPTPGQTTPCGGTPLPSQQWETPSCQQARPYPHPSGAYRGSVLDGTQCSFDRQLETPAFISLSSNPRQHPPQQQGPTPPCLSQSSHTNDTASGAGEQYSMNVWHQHTSAVKRVFSRQGSGRGSASKKDVEQDEVEDGVSSRLVMNPGNQTTGQDVVPLFPDMTEVVGTHVGTCGSPLSPASGMVQGTEGPDTENILSLQERRLSDGAVAERTACTAQPTGHDTNKPGRDPASPAMSSNRVNQDLSSCGVRDTLSDKPTSAAPAEALSFNYSSTPQVDPLTPPVQQTALFEGLASTSQLVPQRGPSEGTSQLRPSPPIQEGHTNLDQEYVKVGGHEDEPQLVFASLMDPHTVLGAELATTRGKEQPQAISAPVGPSTRTATDELHQDDRNELPASHVVGCATDLPQQVARTDDSEEEAHVADLHFELVTEFEPIAAAHQQVGTPPTPPDKDGTNMIVDALEQHDMDDVDPSSLGSLEDVVVVRMDSEGLGSLDESQGSISSVGANSVLETPGWTMATGANREEECQSSTNWRSSGALGDPKHRGMEEWWADGLDASDLDLAGVEVAVAPELTTTQLDVFEYVPAGQESSDSVF